MPAMKMTAKKSTGGVAPRVVLTMPDQDSSTIAVQGMDVCNDGSEHNNFCIVCRDGSNKPKSLICCNDCPRVTCLNCMDVPTEFRQAILSEDVTFRCVACHIGRKLVDHAPEPYFGFYRGGLPLLDTFLPILASLEVSKQAQISSSPVLFVHLTLIDHDTTGGPFELAYRFYEPYFPAGGIEYREVTFDVATVPKATDYQRQVKALVEDLGEQRYWSRVVVALTNHTDNDTGDPFAGYVNGKYISAPVDNFLAIILKPWQPLIDRAKESFLWFFSCGALVNNVDSFAALQKCLLAHRITASIAFTAPRFQPSFTSHLLLAFVELVLIERVSISHAFPHMLGQSNKLGRHTDIILMLTETLAGGLGVTKYSWANIDHRPWGQNLPIQCPECGLVNSWRSASKAGAYLFECMKDGCRKLLRFDKPANARMLMQGKTSSSCWLAIELDSSA